MSEPGADGFLDAAAARRAARRGALAREAQLLVIDREAERIAQRIEQRVEMLDRAGRIMLGGEGAKVLRNARRRYRQLRNSHPCRHEGCDHKMFESGKPGFDTDCHNGPSTSIEAEASRAESSGHCLSGGAK